MSYLKLFLLSGVLLLTASSVQNEQTTKGPVLVQLFTSQGCSSCPPADDLLQKVADEYPDLNVQVLSYHVDYWNRLGWKDPFSSNAFTQMQYDYADQFNSNRVYTPQAVVNGLTEFTGSNKNKMERAIAKYRDQTNISFLEFDQVDHEGSQVSFQLDYRKLPPEAIISVAVSVIKRTTSIKRGENRNRSLTNAYIVANETSYQASKLSQVLKLGLPDWVVPSDKLHLTAYVKDQGGNVVAVTGTDL